MSSTQLRNELKKAFQIAVVVNGAVIASLILYAVIVEIVKSSLASSRSQAGFAGFFFLRYVFFAISILYFFAIRIIRRILLRKSAASDSRVLLSTLLRASIITASLCELPAILGLVLLFMGEQVKYFYFFLFISFLLIFIYFPRYQNWEEWTKESLQIYEKN